mmetsp:Transcript_127505/g.291393  ORF Transcript_127505/g.291393 Transcript_127505/m.291393 type:complete len:208 (+) Transcript_127505:2425-3048(+)
MGLQSGPLRGDHPRWGLRANGPVVQHYNGVAMGNWSSHGVNQELPVGAQGQIAQSPHHGATHSHLCIHVGEETGPIADHKDRRIGRIPDHLLNGPRDIRNGQAIIVHRVVQICPTNLVNHYNPRSGVIRVDRPQPRGVPKLIHLCTISKRVVLQMAVGMGVDEENPSYGGARNTSLVLLLRENHCLRGDPRALGLNAVQVNPSFDEN